MPLVQCVLLPAGPSQEGWSQRRFRPVLGPGAKNLCRRLLSTILGAAPFFLSRLDRWRPVTLLEVL